MPKPQETGALLKMVEDSRISLNAAKSVFAAMCRSGKGAEQPSAPELGLTQVSDEAAIGEACDRVSAADAKLAGPRRTRRAIRIFVGAVIEAMGGKGDPKVVNEVLRRKLAG